MYQLDLCIILVNMYSILPLLSILTAIDLVQATHHSWFELLLTSTLPHIIHLPKSWRNLFKTSILSLLCLKSPNGFPFHLEYNKGKSLI